MLIPDDTLTEPLTLVELGRWYGIGRDSARYTVKRIAGAKQCGRFWQVPISRMPVSYLIAKGLLTSADIRELAISMARAIPDTASMLMTERDVAIALRISPTDLEAIVERGELPRVVIGGQVRFRPADIRLYVDQNLK